jgi:hypothetical protein
MNALDTWRASLPDTPEERLPKPLKLVIPGAPRTKKNSPVLITGMTDAWLKDLVMDFQRELVPIRFQEEATVLEWLRNRETALPHPKLLPSQAYRDWEAAAIKGVLPELEPLRKYFPINYSCHLLAKVYRERDAGDWCGYMQGIGDFLEDIGVLEDDVLLRSFDGSRLLKDAENPRIELWLLPYYQETGMGLFELPAREWAQHEEPEPEEVVSADEEQRRTGSILYSIYGGRRHG